jgi:hypothetical protein
MLAHKSILLLLLVYYFRWGCVKKDFFSSDFASIGQFLERGINIHWLITQVYTHLFFIIKIIKEPILAYSYDSQKCFWKKPIFGWFFHESHQFFKVLEITKINGSLILKYLKNQNQWFFQNSKNCPSL